MGWKGWIVLYSPVVLMLVSHNPPVCVKVLLLEGLGEAVNQWHDPQDITIYLGWLEVSGSEGSPTGLTSSKDCKHFLFVIITRVKNDNRTKSTIGVHTNSGILIEILHIFLKLFFWNNYSWRNVAFWMLWVKFFRPYPAMLFTWALFLPREGPLALAGHSHWHHRDIMQPVLKTFPPPRNAQIIACVLGIFPIPWTCWETTSNGRSDFSDTKTINADIIKIF